MCRCLFKQTQLSGSAFLLSIGCRPHKHFSGWFSQADHAILLASKKIGCCANSISSKFYRSFRRIRPGEEDAITLEYQENQKNYEETIAMREAGLKTEVDILSAKASLDLAEVSLLKAQNDKQHAASTLKTKINSDLKHLQGISINTKLDLPPINAEIVYQNAMRDNSSILLAQNRLQTSRYEVDKSYAAFLPKVDLSVSVSQDLNDDLFEWDNKSVNASIKASVGLYNGQADVNTHKQKSLEYVSSQANLDNAYYDLSIQLDKSFSDYENAKAQIKATYSAIQSSQAQMAAIQEKSHSGLATELEVLSAISQVSKAQQKFFEASYQMVTTYLELHALTGHISYDTLQAINSLLTIDISVD